METIAHELGISKSLVSLTLNDKYGVASNMRYEIYKKAIELGYDFNYKYKKKKPEYKRSICIFINKEFAVSSNYFGKFLEGAEGVFVRYNYKYDLVFWDDNTTFKDIFDNIVLNIVKGFIVLKYLKEDLLNTIKALGVPIEYVDEDHYLYGDYTSVKMHNYQAGAICASYLYNKGHRNIGLVFKDNKLLSYAERFYGIRNLYELYNDRIIPEREKVNLYYSYDNTSVEEKLKKFQSCNPIPTAIICLSKDVLKEVVEVLKKYNQYKKVSLIVIDNGDIIKDFNEKITTIKSQTLKIGEIAAKNLITDIYTNETIKKTIIIPAVIKEYNSVVDLNNNIEKDEL